MRVHTRTVIDIASGEVLEDHAYDYFGPVALAGGGGGSGTSKDQLKEQNKLQQESFDAQMSTLNSLKSSLSGYLSGTQGFNPQMLAEMRSQALNQNSEKFAQAGNQVRAALLARGMGGGTAPGGGSQASALSSLAAAKASDSANAMNTINLQNNQQALSNQFNAASVLSGNAQTMGMNNSVFGQGANNALGNYVHAQQSTFGNQLMGGLGAGLGGGLSAGLTGGIGTGLSTLGSGMFGW